MCCADLRVLFVAAAGARRGFGHLVRCRSLATATGVRPLIAVRGGQRVVDTALLLGCDVIPDAGTSVVKAFEPDVVVVDDPIAAPAARWIAAGRRVGALVVSIHDLGLGCLHADLVVDGSVTRTARAVHGTTLAGTEYAVLDPALAALRSESRAPGRVLISLGGGPRVARAAAIARAIARIRPDVQVRVVGGFLAAPADDLGAGISWIDAPRGLGEELSRADVAVVGGGVSLYEACALGIPAVGVPVVPAQAPTVAAFRRRGAVLGVSDVTAPPLTIAARAARLLQDARLRDRVTRTARQAVDGQGAARVAATIAALSRQRRQSPARAAQPHARRIGGHRCTCVG